MAKILGHLTLVGDDFDTALVTKLIGRPPTRVREKTDVLCYGQLFGHCEWGVETEYIETDDLQPVSDLLREMINCPAQLLRKIAQDCNAEWKNMYCVKVYDDFPALWFNAEFIQFVAEIGGDIDFDGYLLGGPDIDETCM